MCDERGIDPWIEVDGIKAGNAWKVIEAGANAIVSGSGVFNQPDYAEAIKESAPAAANKLFWSEYPYLKTESASISKAGLGRTFVTIQPNDHLSRHLAKVVLIAMMVISNSLLVPKALAAPRPYQLPSCD